MTHTLMTESLLHQKQSCNTSLSLVTHLHNTPVTESTRTPSGKLSYPPSSLSKTVRAPYYNPLSIENPYASLSSFIDTIYPPQLCPMCDRISPNRTEARRHTQLYHKSQRGYQCIHPHCDLRFASRGALRFHISRSHLIRHAAIAQPDPPFLSFAIHPPIGSFSPTTKSHPRSPSSSPLPSSHIPNSKALTHSTDQLSTDSRTTSEDTHRRGACTISNRSPGEATYEKNLNAECDSLFRFVAHDLDPDVGDK